MTATRGKTISSELFHNDDHSIVLVDIPRSLEESQVLPGHVPERRIASVEPVTVPFATPEPKNGAIGMLQTPASQVADLMTAATVQSALEELRREYNGPLCLPRLTCPVVSAEGPIEYLLPQSAEYLYGSIQDSRQAFLTEAPKFDLIVLDPPWPNRSARRRKNSYVTAPTLSELRRLLDLIPIPSHLKADGLVAIWITNKPAILDFLSSPNGLLASWGLELVTEWTWVKITAAGDPLYDIDSTWRRPWEKLIIVKRRGAQTPRRLRAKVIFAVPDIHSRKPNLRGLFGGALELPYTGLEVFARNLTTGWWSWGDEVLQFQGSQHWGSTEGADALPIEDVP